VLSYSADYLSFFKMGADCFSWLRLRQGTALRNQEGALVCSTPCALLTCQYTYV
jgi:hypothetical protein